MSAPTYAIKSARTSPEASKKSAAKVQQLPSPTKSPKQPAKRMQYVQQSGSPKATSKPGKTVLPLHRTPSSTSLSPLTPSDDATAPTQELMEASSGLLLLQDPNAHLSEALTETTATAETEANAATAVLAAAEAEAEVARIRKERGNGMINLIYEQYDEEFSIVDGSTTQAAIDDVYCLSFVMPECLVHLTRHAAPERFAREDAGVFDSLVREDPQGVYVDLEKDTTYYVVVEQEADRLKRDQDATRARWAPQLQREKRERDNADDGRGFESCSCVYGNPCVDEYGCRDWHARFAVATANGWKGF
uniref:Uncharacterized protein n=1 Tax=Globisporangium ultimum (strain ATCC 200006 / CBS 805.95 / DAOM BR144) TaxID=431595 RepID=K3WKZ6_GLOUD